MRSRLASLFGPLTDLLAYFAVLALGASAARSQLLSFAIATAVNYLPRAGAHALTDARASGVRLYLHLIVVTLSTFFLRSGVFGLLTDRFGWSGLAVMALTVLVTAAVIRPGYQYCVHHSRWTLGTGAGWRIGVMGAVAFALLLRLVYAGQVELLPEEAYYWNYSRHLDIGYLDHPPMVGWLIGAGTAVFGDTEFGVRIGALCCGALATFFTYRLARNLFGAPSGLVAAFLMQTLPFFFLAGMLMTPDAPLAAAWAGALYFLERALIAGERDAWWPVALCLGLGLLSKYTIIFVGASAFIFILVDARSRPWLRRWEPYAAALLALAIFSPVIVWNAHNDWASFVFQTSRRLAQSPRFALHELIASAMILLTPTGFAATTWLLLHPSPADAAEDAGSGRKWRFIQLAVLVPVAVFVVFSLRHEVKLDWTGAPWVAAVPALAFGAVRTGGVAVLARIRSAWVPTVVGLLLIYGAGLYHLTLGIPGLGYGRHPELLPVGWRAIGASVSQIAAKTEENSGQEPLIVGMDRYALASELAFYAPNRAKSVRDTSSGHLFGQVGLMYERWFPPAKQRGRTLLLVAWQREDLATARIAASVDWLAPIEEGIMKRNNEIVRRYYYRLAHGYRGTPTPE